jgi:hypothetical protein
MLITKYLFLREFPLLYFIVNFFAVRIYSHSFNNAVLASFAKKKESIHCYFSNLSSFYSHQFHLNQIVFKELNFIGFEFGQCFIGNYLNFSHCKVYHPLSIDNIFSGKKVKLHLYGPNGNIAEKCVEDNLAKQDFGILNQRMKHVRHLFSKSYEHSCIFQSIYTNVFFSNKFGITVSNILPYLNKFNRKPGNGIFIGQSEKSGIF